MEGGGKLGRKWRKRKTKVRDLPRGMLLTCAVATRKAIITVTGKVMKSKKRQKALIGLEGFRGRLTTEKISLPGRAEVKWWELIKPDEMSEEESVRLDSLFD